jgi:hypothetical protein
MPNATELKRRAWSRRSPRIARLADGVERLSPDRALHEVEQSRIRAIPTQGDQTIVGTVSPPLDAGNEGRRLQRTGPKATTALRGKKASPK